MHNTHISQNRLLRAGADSWIMSGLVTVDAGQPFSVTDSANNSPTGLGLDLADRVPNTRGLNRRQYTYCSARTLLTVNGYAVAVFFVAVFFSNLSCCQPRIERLFHPGWHRNGSDVPTLANKIHDSPTFLVFLLLRPYEICLSVFTICWKRESRRRLFKSSSAMKPSAFV